MTKRITSAFWLLLAVTSFSQAQHWVYDIGGPSNDQVSDVKTDDNGEIYITGEFSGLIAFDGQTFLSAGGIDFFLAKLNSAGGLIWWAQGGGPGIDRGIKLCLGDNGTVAVVGEYMGTATISGAVLQSQAGSQDLFIASYSAATGSLQWIDDGGGPLSGDRPYGVAVAPNGNVTMAGEFRGTSDIGTTTLTSMLDPNTLQPSVDVFIASYSPTGTPLWVKHGAAEFTDRSIDAVCDTAGNVYVCGQFSDTIAFDNTYLNAMYNATFIIKYDAAGNELWFRRVGGAIYDHVRDMQWSATGELVLLGDLQGTMIFLDQAPDLITSSGPYSYYLMRVSPDGEYIHAALTGSQNPISGRALEARGDSVLVLGQFECQWTQPIDSASTGIFMATGTQDLFTAIHPLDSLQLVAAQQYGGQQEKLAGGIASLPSGEAVFSGSYEDILIFPAAGLFEADLQQMSGGTSVYCGDQSYGEFAADTSNGLKDGFIAKGWVRDRSPYDMWVRDDNLCWRDAKPLCIVDFQGSGCVDTLEVCGAAWLTVDPHMDWDLFYWAHFTSYDLAFQWSTGSDSTIIHVTSTGWYWLNVESTNGCWSFNDSMYVVVNAVPNALISDDWVVNTAATQASRITLCDPDSVWIWCASPFPGATYQWTNTLDTVVVMNDSIQVDTTVTYYLLVTTPAGCMAANYVDVLDLPAPPLTGITALIDVFYPNDLDLNDTVSLCTGQDLWVAYQPSWMLNGSPYSLPLGMGVRYRIIPPGGGFSGLEDGGPHSALQSISVSGWYYHTAEVYLVNQPCGSDSVLFTGSDSIYVELIPSIAVNVTVSGPAIICPGDTALLVAVCDTCTSLTWSGPGIVSQQGGVAYAVLAGNYTAYAQLLDSAGCTHQDQGLINVAFPPDPELDVFPTDGIICPDSTAIVFTDAVGQHSWYGPNGLELSTNDSIWVNTPGEYYLQTIDTMGCLLNSDPVLVSGYATPYLSALPDAVLCINEGPMTLQVVSTNYSSLVWDAPLTGNSTQQVVSQPGTYSCSVIACGIVTQLQAVVVQGSAVADLLTPGPFVICPGDTVLLEAASGQALYVWQPGGQLGSSLATTQEGSYQVVAIDPNGCSDTSAVVVVDVLQFALPLSVQPAYACAGDSVLLTVSGSGQLVWYSDALLTDSIGSGSQFQLPALFNDTTLYVSQSENGCTSLAVAVDIVIYQVLQVPIINGPDTVCTGSAVQLLVSGPPGASFDWTTPNGPFNGASLVIDPVQFIDAGAYTVVASINGCYGPAGSFQLTVLPPAVLDLGPDLSACWGDAITLSVPAGFSSPQWSTGSTGNTISIVADQQVTLSALDSSGCLANDEVVVSFTIPAAPLYTLGDEVCLGVDAVITGSGSGDITWTADTAGLDTLGLGGTLTIVQPTGPVTVYAWQTVGPCTWGPYPALVIVNAPPDTVEAFGPAFACAGEDVQIDVNVPLGTQVDWVTPNGSGAGDPLFLGNVQPSDAGTYTAYTSMDGCIGDSASWSLIVFVPAPLDLGPDTAFCVGGTFTIQLPPGFSDPLWNDGSTGNAVTTGIPGYYSVEAVDANGCAVSDGVLLSIIDCEDVVPNAITPNGDGVNDEWTLVSPGSIGAHLIVFDRFGDKVYDDDPRARPFNGKHQVSGEVLSDGVYFYVLGLERFGGAFDEVKGYLHLSR